LITTGKQASIFYMELLFFVVINWRWSVTVMHCVMLVCKLIVLTSRLHEWALISLWGDFERKHFWGENKKGTCSIFNSFRKNWERVLLSILSLTLVCLFWSLSMTEGYGGRFVTRRLLFRHIHEIAKSDFFFVFLSVEQLGSHWTDCHKISYLSIF
jgi:hypothetical protein